MNGTPRSWSCAVAMAGWPSESLPITILSMSSWRTPSLDTPVEVSSKGQCQVPSKEIPLQSIDRDRHGETGKRWSFVTRVRAPARLQPVSNELPFLFSIAGEGRALEEWYLMRSPVLELSSHRLGTKGPFQNFPFSLRQQYVCPCPRISSVAGLLGV